MFGYITANLEELTEEEKTRYGAVYCGICRAIKDRSNNFSRLCLRYDMAFLALLLMSLYEPEETLGKRACHFHPIVPRPWVDNPYIAYSADMNLALACYKAMDDAQDENKLLSKKAAHIFARPMEHIRSRYPRQCRAMEECMAELAALEKENCQNPDLPAGCFGKLMAELMVCKEDMWSDTLRQLGHALGRYIYLADAAVDYRYDLRKKQYNPFIAMGCGDPKVWEEYLVLAMGRCTDHFERLPLVQDKGLLDNILYSGVWVEYRRRGRKHDG